LKKEPVNIQIKNGRGMLFGFSARINKWMASMNMRPIEGDEKPQVSVLYHYPQSGQWISIYSEFIQDASPSELNNIAKSASEIFKSQTISIQSKDNGIALFGFFDVQNSMEDHFSIDRDSVSSSILPNKQIWEKEFGKDIANNLFCVLNGINKNTDETIKSISKTLDIPKFYFLQNFDSAAHEYNNNIRDYSVRGYVSSVGCPGYDAENDFQKIVSKTYSLLKPLGYKKARNKFCYLSDDRKYAKVVEFQKSSACLKNYISFTVNIYVFTAALQKTELLEKDYQHKYNYDFRLGRFSERPWDEWFDLLPNVIFEKVESDFFTRFHVALNFLNSFSTENEATEACELYNKKLDEFYRAQDIGK